MNLYMNRLVAVTTALLSLHCGASSNPQNAMPVVPTPAVISPVAASVSTTKLDAAAQPTYLARIAQSGDLYARKDGHIVDAPAADIAVLRGYPTWPAKGTLQWRFATLSGPTVLQSNVLTVVVP